MVRIRGNKGKNTGFQACFFRLLAFLARSSFLLSGMMSGPASPRAAAMLAPAIDLMVQHIKRDRDE